MRLLKLSLKNFKGCRSFVLDVQGNNCNIYGDNATFKTTLYDAFLWLLFNKDSQGKADFEIKTLDATGQPLHGLEHSVEADLVPAGDSVVTIKKSYAEMWQKKRGSAKEVFTGHTTEYFIDGVPVKKTEYASRIAGLCDENIFKLLTNPLFFNTQLHWQKRREILFSICGDISDEDVITSDSSLAKLPAILKNRKLEDHRKVIMGRRTEINQELEKIPIRIDEVFRSLPDVSGVFPSEVANKITVLKTRLTEKNQEVVRIQAGGQVAEKTKALREAEAGLLYIRNKYRLAQESKIQALRADLQALYVNIDKWSSELRQTSFALAQNQAGIDENETSITRLREEWYTVNSRQIEYSPESVCPACGQDLPEENLAQACENAVAAFNLGKAEELEKISAEGKKRRLAVEGLQSSNEKLEREATGLKKFIADAQVEAGVLQEQINNPPTSEDPEYIRALQAITNKKESLEKQISELATGEREGRVTVVEAEIGLLENEISALKDMLDSVDRQEKGQVRIDELKQQERVMAAEFEKLEGELRLTEEFIRIKVRMLEEKINSRFKLAEFRLFENQINSGISECCDVTLNGVPFGSMNSAGRIQVGLDIISVLCENYNFYPPIWCDNRESTVEIPEVKNQIINLYVSKKDTKLRVEIENGT